MKMLNGGIPAIKGMKKRAFRKYLKVFSCFSPLNNDDPESDTASRTIRAWFMKNCLDLIVKVLY